MSHPIEGDKFTSSSHGSSLSSIRMSKPRSSKQFPRNGTYISKPLFSIGSADIKVTATEMIKARVSGSGDIRYKGNPKKIDTKTSGSGDISSY